MPFSAACEVVPCYKTFPEECFPQADQQCFPQADRLVTCNDSNAIATPSCKEVRNEAIFSLY
jgi:hypothetical protein